MKVAIIDDEEHNILVIKKILQSHFPLILVVIEEGVVETAVGRINSEQPDLVFMDIKLKNGTGFDVISGLTCKPKIIFITAYSEFAIEAIKVRAFDYLLKPLDDNELISAIKELQQIKVKEKIYDKKDTELNMDFYHYATTAGKMSIRKSDILFFEGSGAYTYIVTESQKVMISRSIGEIEFELRESNFYRTHNSFIVNITKIRNIDIKRGGFLTLKNGCVVPVSQRKTREFMKVMGCPKKQA